MGALNFLWKYIFGLCPKSKLSNLKYSSQQVTRVSRLITHSGRKPTQQTEHDLELKRLNYERNRKSWLQKNWTENPLKISSAELDACGM